MHAHVYTVCLIDPDEDVRDALGTLLQTSGTKLRSFSSAEEFLGSVPNPDSTIGWILAEADLPGMGCFSFLRRLRANGVAIPVIVLASTSDRAIAEQAIKAGALEVIEKPLMGDRLLEQLFPTTCGCHKSASGNEISAVAESACNCKILKND